jgi:hypothetical protein
MLGVALVAVDMRDAAVTQENWQRGKKNKSPAIDTYDEPSMTTYQCCVRSALT